MIQHEEFEYCKVKVHYVADQDLVKEKQDEAFRELKKTKPKVPGFRQVTKNSATKKKKKGRKGKGGRVKPFRSSGSGRIRNSAAYGRALKQIYKKHLDDVVKKELVAEAYDEVLFETRMKPIGYPQITNSNLDESDFSCDMIFMKKPDFELGEYTGLEIPKPHIETTPLEAAAKMLQDLRVRHGDMSVYGENDTVQMGDQITVDFLCEVEGEPCAELTKEGFLHMVGTNAIPGFDENLIGMKPGDERSFDVEMGETFVKELQGKVANFTAKVHMGTKNVPCALDDTLAEKLGYESFAALNKAIDGSASAQLKMQEESDIEQQIINRLLDGHDFEVPYWLVEMEAQKLAISAGAKWASLSDEQKGMANDKATKSVKLSMIFDSIREAEPDTSFSDDEIISSIRERVSSQGHSPEEFISRAQKDGSLLGMMASLRDEATVKWLISQSKIVE